MDSTACALAACAACMELLPLFPAWNFYVFSRDCTVYLYQNSPDKPIFDDTPKLFVLGLSWAGCYKWGSIRVSILLIVVVEAWCKLSVGQMTITT
jgi:hypothetical protein